MDQHPQPTLAAERRAAIARTVAEEGSARVTELADRFGVSATTIRRDMKVLEKQGTMERVHGGAVAPSKQVVPEKPRATPGTQERRIGQAVAKMITDGETIFLGPGRLPLEVACCLTNRSRLTVVTNGLEVAYQVATNTPHTLIVTGGQAEGRDLKLVGQLTRASLSSLRADHVILELGGISAIDGLTEDSLAQAEVARLLLQIGSEVIALVPVERVGRVAATHIGPISDADVVVTAREAPSPFLWDLSESGVRIVLA